MNDPVDKINRYCPACGGEVKFTTMGGKELAHCLECSTECEADEGGILEKYYADERES